MASLIAIAAFIGWQVQPSDPVNADNFDRIQVGMTISDVEQILGGAGEEAQGERNIPITWHGRGRNAITVYFTWRGDGPPDVSMKYKFDPTLWDRVKEWWGGYELHPGGGRSKELDAAA